MPTEGWERRFMAAGPRIAEAEQLYASLGFEVRLEKPATDDLREACAECRLALEFFRVVYTGRLP